VLDAGVEHCDPFTRRREVGQAGCDRLRLDERSLRRGVLVAAGAHFVRGRITLALARRALRRQVLVVLDTDLVEDRPALYVQLVVCLGDGDGARLERQLEARVEGGVEERGEDLLLVL
jgi:hypothetical protein